MSAMRVGRRARIATQMKRSRMVRAFQRKRSTFRRISCAGAPAKTAPISGGPHSAPQDRTTRWSGSGGCQRRRGGRVPWRRRMFGVTVRSQVGRSSQRACQPAVVLVLVADPGQPVRGGPGPATAVPRPALADGLARPARRRPRRPRPTPPRGPAPAGSAGPRRGPRGWPRRAGRPRSSAARATTTDCILLEDAQPDLLDLVAERRRALELELLGRRPHLGLHPSDRAPRPSSCPLHVAECRAPRAPRHRPRSTRRPLGVAR